MNIVSAGKTNVMTLCELLGIELPLIQAPMAGSQAGALAVAVSNAGGLGSLPCALLSLEQMRAELTIIRAQTARPFNVNFFCHAVPQADARREAAWRELLSPYFKEFGIAADDAPAAPARAPFSAAAADVLEPFRPACELSFWPARRRSAGTGQVLGLIGFCFATTLEEARWLEQHGADAIIAQGLEAAGIGDCF